MLCRVSLCAKNKNKRFRKKNRTAAKLFLDFYVDHPYNQTTVEESGGHRHKSGAAFRRVTKSGAYPVFSKKGGTGGFALSFAP